MYNFVDKGRGYVEIFNNGVSVGVGTAEQAKGFGFTGVFSAPAVSSPSSNPATQVKTAAQTISTPKTQTQTNPTTQTKTTTQAQQLTAKPLPTTALSPGMESPEVKKLQDYLVQHGYLTAEEVASGPGIYGPKTIKAVTALQKDIGVDTSAGGVGTFGPRTLSALSSPQEATIQHTDGSAGGGTKPASVVPQEGTQGQVNPDGTTGPMATYDVNGLPTVTGGGTPYLMGNDSIIRFENGMGPTGYTNNQTLWLLDSDTQTIRPFESLTAANNFFTEPIDINKIVPVDPKQLSPGGMFGNYQTLSNEYVIKNDGTTKQLDFTNKDLAVRYGQGINKEQEQTSAMALDGFLDTLTKSGSGISSNTLTALKNDPTKMAFYLNALAYGDYSLPDVYRDIRKKELGITGVTPISSTATRAQNQITPEGLSAMGNSQLTPPPMIGNVDISKLNLAISDMPPDVFKTLVPILDKTSDEFKSQLSTIEDSYHDILMQQNNAKTQQEVAVAQYNWDKLRKDIATNYGVQLSENAIQAGNQLEQMNTAASTQGILGSGIQNQSVDKMLNTVRRSDQNSRTERLSKEEADKANFYMQYGTSQQIQALIDEDKAKGLPQDQWRATKWGLVPSEEVKAEFSLANLKAKYPQTSDEELQQYASAMLDANGNYRSGVSQRQMATEMDLLGQKKSYQEDKLYSNNLNKELNAYAPYTQSDSPFVRSADGTTGGTTGIPSTQSGTMINLKDTYGQTNNTGSTPQSTIVPQSYSSTPYTPTKTQSTGSSLLQSLSKGINNGTITTDAQAKALTPQSYTSAPVQQSTASPLLKNLSMGLNNGSITTQSQASALNTPIKTPSYVAPKTVAPKTQNSTVGSTTSPNMLWKGVDWVEKNVFPIFGYNPNSYIKK